MHSEAKINTRRLIEKKKKQPSRPGKVLEKTAGEVRRTNVQKSYSESDL